MDEILKLIRGILPGLWRHRWSGLLVAVLVGVVGAAVALKLPNKYQASARVYVDTQSILKPLMAGLTVQPNFEQQIAMVGRTLVNRPNLERMLAMADLEFESDDPAARDRFIDRLKQEVQFSTSGGPNMYGITYRNENPENARKVVESLLNIFVENNVGDKRRDGAQARKFIDEQLVDYEQRLLAAESALKEFKIRNLGSMPGEAQDFVTRNVDAKRELEEARADLRQAESARDALRREVAAEVAGMPDPSKAEQRQMTETDVRLQASHKRLDSLLVQYTERHPDVINTRESIAQLEDQKRIELEQEARRKPSARSLASLSPINTAYSTMRSSLAEMEAKVAALRSRVGTAQARLAESVRAAKTVPQVEAAYVQLSRDYETYRKQYEQLLARRESAQISDKMDSSSGVAEFRVVEPPRVASRPVSPNRPLLLGIALGGSVAAGLGFAFLLAQLRPAFFDAHELRQATGKPMVGNVSQVMGAASRWRRRFGVYAYSIGVLLYLGVFSAAIAYVATQPISL